VSSVEYEYEYHFIEYEYESRPNDMGITDLKRVPVDSLAMC
jgi:hypothetical protein